MAPLHEYGPGRDRLGGEEGDVEGRFLFTFLVLITLPRETRHLEGEPAPSFPRLYVAEGVREAGRSPPDLLSYRCPLSYGVRLAKDEERCLYVAYAERSSSHEEKRAEAVFEGGKRLPLSSCEDTDPPLPHLASTISSLPAL